MKPGELEIEVMELDLEERAAPADKVTVFRPHQQSAARASVEGKTEISVKVPSAFPAFLATALEFNAWSRKPPSHISSAAKRVDPRRRFCHFVCAMDEFKTVLGAVVPIFGIAGVGLLIRKLNWLTEEADQSLLRVNINLLLPCLILDSAIGNPALGQWRNLLLAPAVGFGTVALGMALAFAARPLHGLTDRRSARTFGVSVGIYNYGYAAAADVVAVRQADRRRVVSGDGRRGNRGVDLGCDHDQR